MKVLILCALVKTFLLFYKICFLVTVSSTTFITLISYSEDTNGKQSSSVNQVPKTPPTLLPVLSPNSGLFKKIKVVKKIICAFFIKIKNFVINRKELKQYSLFKIYYI